MFILCSFVVLVRSLALFLVPMPFVLGEDIAGLYASHAFVSLFCEPLHDKTNKISVLPAKTQISLGIHPV